MTKYFGIGLSKSGTSSLCDAFSLLGFKSRHYMNEVSYNHMIRKTDGYDYDFVNDLPICSRYRKLYFTFPDSKFILTIRDIDSWIASCKLHWHEHKHINVGDWDKFRIETYGTLYFDEEIFRDVYTTHVAATINFFRPEDLLIMDIPAGDGWEILCPFLNIDPPDFPFPHTNKTYC